MIELKQNDLAVLIKDVNGKRMDYSSIQGVPYPIGIEAPFDFEVLNVTFAVTSTANTAIQFFNSKDDEDGDQILGSSSSKKDKELDPQIEYSKEWAWIKYSVDMGVKAKIGYDLESVGFNLSGKKSVKFNDYRKHKPGKLASKAITDNIIDSKLKFKFIPRLEDVLSLDPGEALSMKVGGLLSGKVNLKMADLLTGSIGILAKVGGMDDTLKLKISGGLTGSFSWKKDDDYILVISRVDKDWFRIGVKKAKLQEITAGVNAGLTLELENPEAVMEVVNNVIEGIVELPILEIDKLLDKVNLEKTIGELDQPLREIASTIAERLNLDEIPVKLNKLKEKIEETKKNLAKKIEKIVKQKATLNFSYEYSRVKTSTTLFQVLVSEDVLKSHHGELIKKDIIPLEDEIIKGNQPGKLKLEKFFQEDTLSIKKSWGFGFSFGKWSLLGKDIKKLKEVNRFKRLDSGVKGKQTSYLGVRQYKGKLGNWTANFSVDFNAEMPGFSPSENPDFSEFKLGLFLLMEWKEPKKREFGQILDQAVSWGIIEESEQFKLLNQLYEDLDGKNSIHISTHLKFDHDAFALKLLPEIIKGNNEHIETAARAFGAAMSYWDVYTLRTSNEYKRLYYGQLWKKYMEKRDLKLDKLAVEALEIFSDAADEFKKKGRKRLAKNTNYLAYREGKMWHTSEPNTFAGIIRLHSKHDLNILDDWDQFLEGAKILARKNVMGGTADKMIKEAWKKMSKFWSQYYYIRVLGTYLSDLAISANANDGHVERTLKISYKDKKDKEEVINIG